MTVSIGYSISTWVRSSGPILRTMIADRAALNAAVSAAAWPSVRSVAPGRSTTRTPARPTRTAIQRLSRTVSPNSGTDRTVINRGAAKISA